MHETNDLTHFFNGALSSKELANMDETMKKLISLYEAWRDADYPNDGHIANAYFGEIIKHISRGVARKVAGFIDEDIVAFEIKANVIMALRSYVPTLGYTPLMFSQNIIANRLREYFRTEKGHMSIHYNENRTKIDRMLIKAGFSQGIYTEGLDAATVHAVTKITMATVARTLAILKTEGYCDSLEDYREKGVKESEYLPENLIGEDPLTKFERKEENRILYQAADKLGNLERFVLFLRGGENKTANYVRNAALKSGRFADEISEFCTKRGRKPETFCNDDINTIYERSKDKMRHLLDAAHGREKNDILQLAGNDMEFEQFDISDISGLFDSESGLDF